MIKIIFYIICLFTLVSAIYTLASKNLVRAVFAFFGTMTGLAGIYVFAFADFVAITQIMVYVGGIVILMLFGIMLSNRKAFNILNTQSIDFKKNKIEFLGGLSLSLLMFALFLSMIILGNFEQLSWMQTSDNYNGTENSATILGIGFMTNYLLPFETISIYLLAVLVGATYLTRRITN